ncbi:hypothetical protein F0L17_02925 [Streptomyces sp. TRM43335]|uniref:Uncharacterized protein n=1 Tax=Streptomyces taklimakanensis TaxID=2569853 RepID=A0A6G2B766_9ACTN|nr:hypothetical protein [Streptomyces taklimakanensis]MTE18100.1 hypothetical protein [Streptomyces taklimakanensis]
MIRALVVVLLLAHALVHLRVWATPADPEHPPLFVPGHSWALAVAHLSEETARAGAVGLASITALLYAAAGVALAAGLGWWAPAAVLAAASGLVLKTLWFNPWLSVGVAVDAGVVLAVTVGWPASLY